MEFKIMQKVQKGFTLIELIVVIVLLGILGVTALGKYQDLSGNAESAAIDAVASELSGSAAINFANSTLGNTGSTLIEDGGTASADTAVKACSTALLGGLFSSGSTPGTYTYAFGTGALPNTNPACDAAGDTYTCVISKAGVVQTSTATLICTGG